MANEVRKCCLCDEELSDVYDLFEYNDSLFCFDCLEIKLEKAAGLKTELTTRYYNKGYEFLGDDDDLEDLYKTICNRYDIKRITWE